MDLTTPGSMAAAPAAITAGGYGGRSYRGYVLGALVVVFTFNFIDRAVLSVVQEPIKAEFGLSDLQLGLLTGPAFALLYTTLGIPIARLAERRSRVAIVSVALALWSVATAVCGLATSYAILFLARVGVSVGEAGCAPASQSLISDYFPADRRATALSIWSLGVPIGTILAAAGGGVLAGAFGWRSTFLVLGVPGLLLALAVKLTVREPPRAGAGAGETPPSMATALGELWAKPAYRHAAFGAAVVSFANNSAANYTSSFLMRVHHLTMMQMGLVVGLFMGASMAIGTFIGGFAADRLSKRFAGAIGWLPGVCLVAATPLMMVSYLAPSVALYLGLSLVAIVAVSTSTPAAYAIGQSVAEPRTRATAAALILVFSGLIGVALAPPALGALSDFFAHAALSSLDPAAARARGLREALIVTRLAFAWAGVHFMLAGRALDADRRANTAPP